MSSKLTHKIKTYTDVGYNDKLWIERNFGLRFDLPYVENIRYKNAWVPTIPATVKRPQFYFFVVFFVFCFFPSDITTAGRKCEEENDLANRQQGSVYLAHLSCGVNRTHRSFNCTRTHPNSVLFSNVLFPLTQIPCVLSPAVLIYLSWELTQKWTI